MALHDESFSVIGGWHSSGTQYFWRSLVQRFARKNETCGQNRAHKCLYLLLFPAKRGRSQSSEEGLNSAILEQFCSKIRAYMAKFSARAKGARGIFSILTYLNRLKKRKNCFKSIQCSIQRFQLLKMLKQPCEHRREPNIFGQTRTPLRICPESGRA